MSVLATAFDVDAATRAYLATFDGAARARSDAYFEGGYWLLLWDTVIGAGLAWALLQFGIAARLSAWARRMTGGRKFLTALLWALAFLALYTLLQLPWSFYESYLREHQYAMSNQDFGQWGLDFLKGTVIGLPLGALVIAVLTIFVRRALQTWWLWGAGIVAIVVTISVALGPVLIEPLFNDYKPMAASPLRNDILKVARANGVPVTNVYVVDQSRQTKRISANVAGLGSTARVALNDNLLNARDDPATLSVMGHETGHYALNHIVLIIPFFALLAMAGFAVVQFGVPALIRANPRWRVDGVTDPAAIAVAVIILTVFFFVLTPLTNSFTRFQESQADIFGLNAARAPDGFARSAIRLGQYRKLEPTPFEEFVFFDHPSGYARIHMAMQWKAEHLGEPGIR